MSYYRHMYTPDQVDEESFFQHRLALAGQEDMMELARLSRMHEVDLTSSFMRYTQPRVGMYQDSNSVYRENCNVPVVTQQSSFNSEDSFQNQGYRLYSYCPSEVSIPHQTYTSSAIGTQENLHSIAPSQQVSTMTIGNENPRMFNDLPTIAERSDLQWLTTTRPEIRTQSPLNTSSPRPRIYPSQPTPPNITLNMQGMVEESSSSVGSSGQFRVQNFSGSSRSQSKSNKKSSSSNPSKPKGTPGRKRKFQDHELTPEEATKRRIRRERNKVAAAKCRNRRRELTDRLQGETDNLEDHKSKLQQEIYSLQQEKDHLEFLLATHTPNCKAMARPVEGVSLVPDDDNRVPVGPYATPISTIDEVIPGSLPDNQFYYLPHSLPTQRLSEVANSEHESTKVDLELENPIKLESSKKSEEFDLSSVNIPTDLSSRSSSYPSQSAACSLSVNSINLETMNEETLNTPVCNLATPTYSTGIFTFPTTPNTCNTTTDTNFSFPASNTTISSKSNSVVAPTFSAPSLNRLPTIPQSCSLAHRRRSSSDSLTSPDSVKSHNLLAL